MNKQKEFLQLAFQLLSCESLKIRGRFIKSGLSVSDFFNLSIDHFLKFGGTAENIPKFLDPIKIATQEIEKAHQNDITIISQKDDRYPNNLKNIFDPPYYLYIKGKETLLNMPMLGVVGSRRHSLYALRILKKFLPPLIHNKIVILSGMANGIDTNAHLIATQNKGFTIGVNAGGLLHLYPGGNRHLFREILQNGCIISEFPLNTIPRPFHFPIRNRIIAGMCQKLWVVEAADKSGSLITARIANENGRDVLATPGPVDIITSQGTNKLIKDGATPILSVNDLLEEFNLSQKHNTSSKVYIDCIELERDEKMLLDLIKENDVKDIDFIILKSKLPTPRVLTSLNGLILKGIIENMPGGYCIKR